MKLTNDKTRLDCLMRTTLLLVVFLGIARSVAFSMWRVEDDDTPEKERVELVEIESATSDEVSKRTEKTPLIGSDDAATDASKKKTSIFSSFITSLGALTLVLGLFLGLVYLIKILDPSRFREKKTSDINILNSYVLGKKTKLLTIHWGEKLILAAQCADSIVPISEISEEDQVEKMLKADVHPNLETNVLAKINR